MRLKIQLDEVGKKFGSEWIFKNMNLTIEPGDKLAILGSNGSGKSTLLQVISGYVLPNKGRIVFSEGEKTIDQELKKDYSSLASPYIELIDEFTFPEIVAHCATYKPFKNNLKPAEVVEIAELSHAVDKPFRTFSSGMKQRAKLSLAILADCPLLLLDEPVSNLDTNAIEWFKKAIAWYAAEKTILVCSNSISEEFDFCDKEINLVNYK